MKNQGRQEKHPLTISPTLKHDVDQWPLDKCLRMARQFDLLSAYLKRRATILTQRRSPRATRPG